jgi:hypothetical protein
MLIAYYAEFAYLDCIGEHSTYMTLSDKDENLPTSVDYHSIRFD